MEPSESNPISGSPGYSPSRLLQYRRALVRVFSINRWSETRLILIVAVVIGLLGGLGAVGFRKLISLFQGIFFGPGSNFLDLLLSLPWWHRLLIPALGGIILSPLIRYFPLETKGHGVPEVMESLALRGGRMRGRTVFTRALASALTLASGGSVGREGPIVQIGSAMGSRVGQLLHASDNRLKTLVGCGAAAGMAATFNAPIGGALFAIEVILGDFALSQVTPIIISSVTATVISRWLLGNTPAFIVHHMPLVSVWEFLFFAGLGILAGGLAWLFVTVLYRSEDMFERTRLPVLARPVVGMLAVGVIGIWFPHVYGSGYDSMDLALDSRLPLLMLLVLTFIKLFATSVTVGSGGSGGVFAPALFQGAMLGGLVGSLLHLAAPGLVSPSGSYALVGMGAMIAGTMQAPITVILIIFELTGDYAIILPVMTASILSSLVAFKLLSGQSIYTRKLVRKGINIYRGRDLNILRTLQVGDVMLPQVGRVEDSTPLPQLIGKALTEQHQSFVLVDETGRMTGLVPLQNVLEVMQDVNLRDLLVAQDLALLDFPVLQKDQRLDEVIRRYGDSGIEEVPVVDPAHPGMPIGMLRQQDMLAAYRRAVIRHDLGAHVARSLTSDPRFHEVELVAGYKMVEIEAPRLFWGQTLAALSLSERYGVQVFLIRKGGPEDQNKPAPGAEGERQMHFVPRGEDRIDPGDGLVLVGTQENLNKIFSLS